MIIVQLYLLKLVIITMKSNLEQHLTSTPNALLDPQKLKHNIDIRLACIEDGLDNTGFRKIAAFIKSIHSNTTVAYVPTANHRNIVGILMEKSGGNLNVSDIHRVAQFMAEGNIAAFSSMTQSATEVYKIIADIRHINPHSYIIWGGIHPIIQPEDAIKYADAVCTGEGEFAFKTFLDLYKNGKDFTTASGFWFRKDNNIIKNRNLPLMKSQEMDELPPLTYQDGEIVYRRSKGFKKVSSSDFLDYTGLQYGTVWSIGCPLHCTYCGNTKFIEYDNAYRRLRHSSPRTIIEEIKRTKSKHPYLSTVIFHDDSFLALPYKTLEELMAMEFPPIKWAVPNLIPEGLAMLAGCPKSGIHINIRVLIRPSRQSKLYKEYWIWLN